MRHVSELPGSERGRSKAGSCVEQVLSWIVRE